MLWPYRRTVLSLCMLAFFATFFGRLVFSPVVPFVVDDLGISNTQIGFALTGMWLSYGLAQFPSGVLADRYGEKRIILLSVGGTLLASVLVALAPLFAVFVVCVVLLGSLAGLHYSVATTLLSRTYDQMGSAVGIHSMGAPLAGLTAPVAAAWVGVNYGWRPAVALTATVSLPVFVLFAWRVRPTEPRRPDAPISEQFALGAIRELLSRPPIAFTLGLAVVATFVVNGLISFLPTFLVETRGFSPTLAGAAFSAYFVVRGAVQIGIGSISDRFGRDFALAGCMLASVVGLLSLVAGPGRLAVGIGILAIGLGASYFPALDPRFLDELSASEQGTGFGLVRTIYVVTGATGSAGVGLFADSLGWSAAFVILAGLALAAFLALSANWALDLGY
jgi:MFS family permease